MTDVPCSIIQSTGVVFIAFCCATIATLVGTFAAWALLGSHLGPEGWKVCTLLSLISSGR